MFDNDIYYYTKIANIISDYFEIQKQRFTKYTLTVETDHHIDSEDFCWGRYCVFESKEWSHSLLMMKEKKEITSQRSYKYANILADRIYFSVIEWYDRFVIKTEIHQIVSVICKRTKKNIIVMRNAKNPRHKYHKYGSSINYEIVIFKTGHVRVKNSSSKKPQWLSLKNWSHLNIPQELRKDLFTLLFTREYINNNLICANRNMNVSNKDLSKISNLRDLYIYLTKTSLYYNKKIPLHLALQFHYNEFPIIIMNKLLNFNKASEYISYVIRSDKQHHDPLLLFYKLVSVYMFGTFDHVRIVADTYTMCWSLKKIFKIEITSIKKFSEYHDELAKEIAFSKIPENIIFKIDDSYTKLKSRANYSVELITNLHRLAEEGLQMHHCVQVYQYSIQEGTCAIYSIVYKENRYTLELNKQLQIAQLTGKYNSKAPQELIDELNTQLQEITTSCHTK